MLFREDNFCVCRASSKSWILNRDFYDAPHFEKKLYNVSDFEEKNSLKRVRNWKLFPFRRSLCEPCYSVEATFFAFPCFFQKHDFDSKNFHCVRLGIWKITKSHFVWLKFSQCVSFWTETFLQPVKFCLELFEFCWTSKNLAFKNSPFCERYSV